MGKRATRLFTTLGEEKPFSNSSKEYSLFCFATRTNNIRKRFRLKLEDTLQIMCSDWLRSEYPNLVWFHPANGENRNVITGMKLKEMGVVAGVADFVFMEARYNTSTNLYHNLRFFNLTRGLNLSRYYTTRYLCWCIPKIGVLYCHKYRNI